MIARAQRNAVRDISRVASVRFISYYALGFMVGYGTPGPDVLTWAVGIVYCALFCVGVELLNRLSDRREDAINQPDRTAQCEFVGYDRIRVVCLGCWILLGILGLVLILLRPGWPSAAAVAGSMAIGAAYSVGPALKTRPVLTLLALSTALSLPVVCGWVFAPVRGNGASVLAGFGLLTLASLSTAGLKDLTDTAGDAERGYRSLWLRLQRSPRAAGIMAGLAALQILVIVLSLLAGLSPTILVCLSLPVLQVLVLRAAAGADGATGRHQVREAMHTTTLLVLVVVLVGIRPGLWSVLASAAAIGWWVFASRALHWNQHLSGGTLAAVLRPGADSRAADPQEMRRPGRWDR